MLSFRKITYNLKTVPGILGAVEAAAEAQGKLDELFEHSNSLSIQEIKIQTEINKQQAIANDRSKSTDERMAALEEILRLEMKLAEFTDSVVIEFAGFLRQYDLGNDDIVASL